MTELMETKTPNPRTFNWLSIINKIYIKYIKYIHNMYLIVTQMATTPNTWSPY